MCSVYFFKNLVLFKSSFINFISNKFSIILFLILLYYLYSFFFFDFSRYDMVDNFTVTSIIFPLYLFSIFFEKVDFDRVIQTFLFFSKFSVIFMFFELISFFLIKNPYSFSPYNGSFHSVIFQNLQIVSLICNIVFANSLYFILNSKSKSINIYNLFLILISIIVCYYTFNRTSLLLFVFISYFLIFKVKGKSSILFYSILFVLLIYVASYFVVDFETSNAQKGDLSDLSSLSIRLLLLFVGFKVLLTNWLVGVGPFLIDHSMAETVQNLYANDIYLALLTLSKNTTLDEGIWTSHPHFAFLNVWLNFGILGFLIYFKVFKILFKSLKNNTKKLILPNCILLILLSHNFFYPQLYWEFLFLFVLYIIFINQKYNFKRT